MQRGNVFVCLLLLVVFVSGMTDTEWYAEPAIFIIGLCLLAHYYLIGGAHLTYRRKKHLPAAKAIANTLVGAGMENLNSDYEQRRKLLRNIIVDGLNNWRIERRLIYSFRLSLIKELNYQEEQSTSPLPLTLTSEIDDAIDNIVRHYDKNPTWR